MSAFQFACPSCGAPLVALDADTLGCPDGTAYRREAGVWRFLTPSRQQAYAQFMAEYNAVRRAEGRGGADDAYYRALPYRDLTGRFTSDWRIRARSHEALVRHAIAPLEDALRRSLKLLDLGAGNGWLSYRLAQRGHAVAAVDLQLDARDGLGAWPHYDAAFEPVQADFDHLPFAGDQMDAVIFNSAFHYSTGYALTLGEALRVAAPGGRVILVDTPVYHDQASGEQMVAERASRFRQAYGFPSNALASENYLTYSRLDELGQKLGIRWRFVHPFYGLRWAMRPWIARIAGRREPAEFMVIVGVPEQKT